MPRAAWPYPRGIGRRWRGTRRKVSGHDRLPRTFVLPALSVGRVGSRVQAKLEALSNMNREARRLQRLLIGHATDLEIDSSGRVLLLLMCASSRVSPKSLCSWARATRSRFGPTSVSSPARPLASRTIHDAVDDGDAFTALKRREYTSTDPGGRCDLMRCASTACNYYNFGRGGHTRALLERLSPEGRILAIDRDPTAILAANSLANEDARVQSAALT